MRYEKKSQPVIPLSRFLLRLARSAAIAGGIIFGGLGIGVLGYHFTENLPWLDALLNASMILAGMGPVNNPNTVAGKWFGLFTRSEEHTSELQSRFGISYAG